MGKPSRGNHGERGSLQGENRAGGKRDARHRTEGIPVNSHRPSGGSGSHRASGKSGESAHRRMDGPGYRGGQGMPPRHNAPHHRRGRDGFLNTIAAIIIVVLIIVVCLLFK